MKPIEADPSERLSRMVVVVEDNQDLAEILVMLLEAEGYVACYALSGKAGLALVEVHRPQVVMLDHMLPDMTGAEVGVQLRHMAGMHDLKIIMYTSTPEEVVRSEFDGYDAFLAKPVFQERLVRTIDAAMKRAA